MSINSRTINSGEINSGAGIALEDATGSVIVTLQQVVAEQGSASAGIQQIIVHGLGSVAVTIQQVISTTDTGSLRITLRQIQYENGIASATLQQVITIGDAGSVSATLRIDITGTGSVSVPIRQDIYNPADYVPDVTGTPQNAFRWKLVVTLAGVDVSASVTGAVRVEGEESAARIASFVLKPAMGAVTLTDWVGKPVTIDHATTDALGAIVSQRRVFTGIVDVPTFDPISRLTAFDCTDDLQGKVEKTPREQLDAMIGGRWSHHIFQDDGDVWQYAQDRLSTVTAALDLDAYGMMTLTPWAAKETPDYTFDASTIEDGSIGVQLAERRALINTVLIAFDYRFARGKARRRTLSWKHPLRFCSNPGTPNLRTASKPTRSMIESAVRGTGWAFGGGTYDLLPPSGAINCGASQNGVQYWSISERIRQNVIVGFDIRIAKVFDQDLTETYALKISAPQSVALVGEIAEEESGSLRADEDDNLEENEPEEIDSCGGQDGGDSGSMPAPGSFSVTVKVPPDPDYIDLVGGGTPGFISNNGDRYRDKTALGNTGEDAAEAMEVLLHKSAARIKSAHRNNTVFGVLPIQPYIDLRHTVRLETPSLAATGKVRSIVHEFDLDSGRAVTEVSIAVSRTDSASSATNSDLIAPNRPEFDGGEEMTEVEMAGGFFGGLDTHLGGTPDAPPCDPDWTGYIGNALQSQVIVVGSGQEPVNFYPERFVIESEEIEAEARDPIEMPAAAEYTISIPNEPLTMAA